MQRNRNKVIDWTSKNLFLVQEFYFQKHLGWKFSNKLTVRENGKEIAIKSGKPYVPTLNDLQKMRDMELIQPKLDSEGKPVKK